MVKKPLFTGPSVGSTASENNHHEPPLFSHSPAILLIEDNRIIQFVMRTNLTTLGCQVHVAQDGIEAMKMFVKTNYALILLDIHMPRMNGLEVAKRIRAHEKVYPSPCPKISTPKP